MAPSINGSTLRHTQGHQGGSYMAASMAAVTAQAHDALRIELELKIAEFLKCQCRATDAKPIAQLDARGELELPSGLNVPVNRELRREVQAGRKPSSVAEALSIYSTPSHVPQQPERLEGACTTVMVKNVPPKLQQFQVVQVLERMGYAGQFDFLYIPPDCGRYSKLLLPRNRGIAYINFKSPLLAQQFLEATQGRLLHHSTWKKAVEVSAAPLQGFDANVRKHLAKLQDPSARSKPLLFREALMAAPCCSALHPTEAEQIAVELDQTGTSVGASSAMPQVPWVRICSGSSGTSDVSTGACSSWERSFTSASAESSQESETQVQSYTPSAGKCCVHCGFSGLPMVASFCVCCGSCLTFL